MKLLDSSDKTAGPRCVSLPKSIPALHQLTDVTAIHGDKQQNERDWVLNEFKTGKSPIMVATDVASRGIGMIDLHFPLPPLSYPSPWLSVAQSAIDVV